MNNVEKAQVWFCSMMILGVSLLIILGENEIIKGWFDVHVRFGSTILLLVCGFYMMLVIVVAEYFVKKDGYKIYVRMRRTEKG